MESKFTLSNVTLTILAIIIITILISTKLFYWEVIDLFALPFSEVLSFHGVENLSGHKLWIYILYTELVQFINAAKSGLLDASITSFGYSIYKPFLLLFGAIFLLCAFYGISKRQNKISIIPMLVCLFGGITYVLLEPVISLESVGQAIVKANDYKDPDIDATYLLKDEKYDELNTRLQTAQQLFENNTIGEYQYADGYEPFKSLVYEDQVYLDRWLISSSDKQYAHIARGLFYEKQGWLSNGSKYYKDTLGVQHKLMDDYFSKAVEEHKAALAINKKSLLSYASLARMRAAYVYVMDRENIFNTAIREFPASHYIPAQYMVHLQPNWGGSDQQMIQLAKRMRAQSVNNPLLIALTAHVLNHSADSLDDFKEKKKRVRLQRFAMFYGPSVRQVIELTLHYDSTNDNKNGIEALSQGLRFYPDNNRLLLRRASHYASDDKVELALADLKNIAPDDLKNSWDCSIIADTYIKLEQPDKGIPYLIRSIGISTVDEYSFNRLYWLAYKGIMSKKKVLQYMKQWTDTHPTSSDAWIAYGDTLKTIDPVLSIHAYKKFIEFANRGNSNDMYAIQYAETYIKTIESNLVKPVDDK